nr:uncharacterized protein LOC128700395 [Cherax quadricarinatus]
MALTWHYLLTAMMCLLGLGLSVPSDDQEKHVAPSSTTQSTSDATIQSEKIISSLDALPLKPRLKSSLFNTSIFDKTILDKIFSFNYFYPIIEVVNESNTTAPVNANAEETSTTITFDPIGQLFRFIKQLVNSLKEYDSIVDWWETVKRYFREFSFFNEQITLQNVTVYPGPIKVLRRNTIGIPGQFALGIYDPLKFALNLFILAASQSLFLNAYISSPYMKDSLFGGEDAPPDNGQQDNNTTQDVGNSVDNQGLGEGDNQGSDLGEGPTLNEPVTTVLPEGRNPDLNQFNNQGLNQFNDEGLDQFNDQGLDQFNDQDSDQLNDQGLKQFNDEGLDQFNDEGLGQFNSQDYSENSNHITRDYQLQKHTGWPHPFHFNHWYYNTHGNMLRNNYKRR